MKLELQFLISFLMKILPRNMEYETLNLRSTMLFLNLRFLTWQIPIMVHGEQNLRQVVYVNSSALTKVSRCNNFASSRNTTGEKITSENYTLSSLNTFSKSDIKHLRLILKNVHGFMNSGSICAFQEEYRLNKTMFVFITPHECSYDRRSLLRYGDRRKCLC